MGDVTRWEYEGTVTVQSTGTVLVMADWGVGDPTVFLDAWVARVLGPGVDRVRIVVERLPEEGGLGMAEKPDLAALRREAELAGLYAGHPDFPWARKYSEHVLALLERVAWLEDALANVSVEREMADAEVERLHGLFHEACDLGLWESRDG